jgi:PhnB protein
VPKGYHSVTPYLTLRNTGAAIEFYKKAFGAKMKMAMPGPDGTIMHAEIVVGDSHIMMGEENLERGTKSPLSLGGSSSGVMLYVKNADAMVDAAVAAGAKIEMPVADQFWGDRYGQIVDPFGHKWSIATHTEDLTPKQMAKRSEEFFKQFQQQ